MSSVREQLEELCARGILRSLRPSQARGANISLADGKSLLNFASNDYLGISGDLDLQSDFLDSVPRDSFVLGSTSSRLLGGDSVFFEDLEKYFAELFSGAFSGARSCLLFNGGFHANTGILPALASPRDLILCDRLSHASIMDSLKLCGAKWSRFRHNDLSHLGELLIKNVGKYENIFIVTEGVFSMDGDRADIASLVKLKKEFGAKLYVDEAHSFGLFGGGLGLCAETGVGAEVDYVMCTLGKAVASQGALAICSEDDRRLLVNRCRPFIFTTALAPISALWTRFVFERILNMDGRRAHLAAISRRLREKISSLRILGDTQIVPVLLGDESAASAVAERLFNEGFWTPAVRYPSVPRGEARLRISLTAAFSEGDIDRLARAINFKAEK